MNPLAKLKEQARNHELREEWQEAASVYQQVLRQARDGEVGELALYNRVGDLFLRMGDAHEAVRYYEQAADQYADAGLFNNAIALCHKALRYAPTRSDLLRKLGRFSASQGFLTDARRWFLEFCERAIRAGDTDGAVATLDEYARATDDTEAREFIARKLLAAGRKDAALTEFRRAWGLRVRSGDAAAADALEAEIRERFPDVGELDIRPRMAEDTTERWGTGPEASGDEASEAPEADASVGGPLPPVGLPGFDDGPGRAANDSRSTPAGPVPGLEQTSLGDGGAGSAAPPSRTEGLETTRLAEAPALPASANGAAPAADAGDDMSWLRGRPSARPGAGGVPASAIPAAPEPPTEYVDLSDLLGINEGTQNETRWFIEENEPTGDEDRDFAELLTQFKEKLSEHIAHDDAGAHYDLGIAFKEMGLLDEAISEFQVALRGNGPRLKILEELGHCFFLKSHHTVAIKVLKRALELETQDELEMIGVYYYLGRALEEQGQPEQARDAYERVVGLDINFQDVADRMARL